VLKSAQRAAEKTRWWLWNSRAGKCCREKLLKMQSLAEFIKRPSQRKCKIAFDKKARTKPTTAASGESGIRGIEDPGDAMRPLVLLSCQYCKLHK